MDIDLDKLRVLTGWFSTCSICSLDVGPKWPEMVIQNGGCQAYETLGPNCVTFCRQMSKRFWDSRLPNHVKPSILHANIEIHILSSD